MGGTIFGFYGGTQLLSGGHRAYGGPSPVPPLGKTLPEMAVLEIRTWGFWRSLQPLLHHTSSAHNSHSALQLISL